MTTTTTKYLSLEELGDLLGKPKTTVKNWSKLGQFRINHINASGQRFVLEGNAELLKAALNHPDDPWNPVKYEKIDDWLERHPEVEDSTGTYR